MQKQEIIVIGDVHGERRWKDIVEKHSGGRFVFLGDYSDPYDKNVPDNEVVENLKQIIEFKKEHPHSVTLLLGNHDVQYIYDRAPACSRFMVNSMDKINAIFKENVALFKQVYSSGGLLFTHAGVTEEWFQTAFPGCDSNDVVEMINKCRDRKALFACGIARWGDELYGGIFWADRREFENPLNGWTQVVGHSRVPDVLLKRTNEKTAIFFCDCLAMGKYLTIEQENGSLYFYEMQLEDDKMTLLHTLQL